MVNIKLSKKTEIEIPIAANDIVEEKLSSDPTMPKFGYPVRPAQNLTKAGTNAANNGESLVENTNHDWINTRWRPAMGWMYMTTCITDFIIFPILWATLQAVANGQVTEQWQPLTLMGAGLFHVAMGTILGIAVYGRTKEKIESASRQQINN